MPKITAAEKHRIANAQFNADSAVLAEVAPRLKAILGYVPGDGLVSVLSQPFRGPASDFVVTGYAVRKLASDPVCCLDALDRAEAHFRTRRELLLLEIRRYQSAAAAVMTVALAMGNSKLTDRALIAVQEYSAYATHVGATKIGGAA